MSLNHNGNPNKLLVQLSTSSFIFLNMEKGKPIDKKSRCSVA